MPTTPQYRPGIFVVSNFVGLAGIGLLGQAFARRLIDARLFVLGFDINASKRAALEQMGGHAAPEIADVARRAAPIIIAVFDTAQVEEVVEAHLLPTLGEGSGKTVMCASTCDPDRIAALEPA
jgi:3-hydroxyisobutyrate dehydrogenase-like beta-hydroxyacid dehydrogenase